MSMFIYGQLRWVIFQSLQNEKAHYKNNQIVGTLKHKTITHVYCSFPPGCLWTRENQGLIVTD